MRTAVLTFAVAAVLIVLLPGPDTLVVVRSLLRHGRSHAAVTVLGVLTGLSVWVSAAALGLSALLRASHNAYGVLRIAGAVYLVWIGVQSLRGRRVPDGTPSGSQVDGGPLPDVPAGPRPGRQPRWSADRPPSGSRWPRWASGFGAGLTTDLLNPKVGVFFVTFLPGFVPHGAPVGGVSVLLGAVFIVLTAAYFTALLLIAGQVTRWMNAPVVRRRLDRATGLVLIGFGIRLAVEA